MNAARKPVPHPPSVLELTAKLRIVTAERDALRETGKRLCAGLLLVKNELHAWSQTAPRFAAGYRETITRAVDDALAECPKKGKS